jgi:hypothetical protein
MKDLPTTSETGFFFVLQVSSGSNRHPEQLDLSPICRSEAMPQGSYLAGGRMRNPAPASPKGASAYVASPKGI